MNDNREHLAHARMAVVGLGHWGKNVLRSFAGTAGCDVGVICDSNAEVLARRGKLYPEAKTVADFESVLDDPNIDAVAIVTPVPLHHAMVCRALSAGKHISTSLGSTRTSSARWLWWARKR